MIYRENAEDFRVEEVPLSMPLGHGDQWYLLVEKRGLDSTEVADALAAAGGCPRQGVGMAGRKDRHAITRQWFSVPAVSGREAPQLSLEGASVLEVSRHPDRLRTGELLGNRFALVVRGVHEAERSTIEARLAEVDSRGFANRFGAQRFGRDGDNAEQGREILLGGKRPRNRQLARFLVSALQSEVFNLTLRLRQEEIGLETLVDGDLVVVHATGALFWIDSAAKEQQRATDLLVSATGPLMGDKMRRPFATAGRWENAALKECGLEEGLFRSRKGLRLFGARRSIRALPKELSVEFSGDAVEFSFFLPPGSYASVFLEEVCGPSIEDAQRSLRANR